jgi:hypothetical protein
MDTPTPSIPFDRVIFTTRLPRTSMPQLLRFDLYSGYLLMGFAMELPTIQCPPAWEWQSPPPPIASSASLGPARTYAATDVTTTASWAAVTGTLSERARCSISFCCCCVPINCCLIEKDSYARCKGGRVGRGLMVCASASKFFGARCNKR